MIHKFQNVHGTTYTILSQLKDYKEEFKKTISSIKEDKKAPFSEVYVRMPVFWLDKFMENLNKEELNYKEIDVRHEKVLIRF